MLQQEELKDLHNKSKEIADELARDRDEILKLKVENKKKLAQLNEYDMLGDEVQNQIDEHKKEIAEKDAICREKDLHLN